MWVLQLRALVPVLPAASETSLAVYWQGASCQLHLLCQSWPLLCQAGLPRHLAKGPHLLLRTQNVGEESESVDLDLVLLKIFLGQTYPKRNKSEHVCSRGRLLTIHTPDMRGLAIPK